MSWDGKALLLLTAVWAVLSILYITVIGMVTGARAWGTGAIIFALLFVWWGERQKAGGRG